MAKKKINKSARAALVPVEDDVNSLIEMFEFFMTERQLGKSIEALSESVKDMRIIIGRMLVDHFMKLPFKEETKFCSELADALADRVESLPVEREEDDGYSRYCIGEILTSFEYATEIKTEFPEDTIMQKMLALDIPILRPFDYGLSGRLQLVEAKKKKRAIKSI